jgi:hypothetical protein
MLLQLCLGDAQIAASTTRLIKMPVYYALQPAGRDTKDAAFVVDTTQQVMGSAARFAQKNVQKCTGKQQVRQQLIF